MTNIIDKSMCTGCTACKNVCPTQCIVMNEDNEGFLYPYVEQSSCINCGKCNKACPILKEKNFGEFKTQAFCVQNHQDMYRSQSTAGGVFAAVALHVVENNGVVYGAGFDDDMNVVHKCVDSLKSWQHNLDLCGSKYVQSDLKNTFSEVKADLLTGKMVLFAGAPCQIEGLHSYLSRNYENLITIDFVCYGVPSPKLYRLWIKYCEKYYKSKIVRINFRDKSFGYSISNCRLYFKNERGIDNTSVVKSYLRMFFAGLISRPSCYKCYFKSIERNSDFTLGDCRYVEKLNLSMDDDLGTTAVLVHSVKGFALLDELKEKLKVYEISVNDVINKKMVQSDCENTNRAKLFQNLENLSYIDAVNIYSPIRMKERISNIIKPIIRKFNLSTSLLKRLKT